MYVVSCYCITCFAFEFPWWSIEMLFGKLCKSQTDEWNILHENVHASFMKNRSVQMQLSAYYQYGMANRFHYNENCTVFFFCFN